MATVNIPAPPKGLLSNLVGLAGLVTICLALAFLTDWRWAMGLAGVFAVALAALAQLESAAPAADAAVPARPRRVA